MLAFRADRWAAKKAAAQAALAVAEWDYPLLDEHDFLKTVHRLVDTAVAAGGKRVSVHLADQDDKILVMASTTRPVNRTRQEPCRRRWRYCGPSRRAAPHTDHDGHAWWALLDAGPQPKKHLA